MKRACLHIVLLILVSSGLRAQGSVQSDTINIDEVIIRGTRIDGGTGGFKVVSVDSSVLKMNSQTSLGELLARHSSIFIKSYGMGGTSTLSFRGTGAGHTQLTWNDININNPMLGQSDLALLPVGMIDAVQIYSGGASMPVGSGGIGGIVNLSSNPVWKNETMISLSTAAGSFGQYSGLAKVRTGNETFQSDTKAFYQYGRNNFSYLNTVSGSEPVWEKRTNSQITQRGFTQELYFRRKNYDGSARIWYESADRNLPSSMLVSQPGLKETQFDESLRTLLNFSHSGRTFKLNFTGAWIMDKLDYNNSLVPIRSRNNSQTIVMKSNAEKMLPGDIKLNLSIDEELNLINSNNYESNKSRNAISLAASAVTNAGHRLGGTLLMRQTLDRCSFLLPDFSAGMKYRLIMGKDFFLRGSFSRNSKIPSLNDLFWLPGGNPGLRNEYALMYEIGADISSNISNTLTFKTGLTIFKNNIRDMIQWHPGNYSYWTADNIKSVNTSGIESSLNLNYSLSGFSAAFLSNYSFTKAATESSDISNDASLGKQLIYVPVHQVNSTLIAGYGKFYSSWIFVFTGRRYVTSDNSGYLPSYLLNNLGAGVKLNLKSNILDLKFQVDNIFSVNYQAIAYYPMPGRSYSLKVLIQFHI